MRTARSTRTNPLALFSAILCVALLPMLVTGCNSPNSAPSTTAASGLSTTSYAGALSLADTLGPTLGTGLCTPSPFLFPAGYLQQQLGLTDSVTAQIERIQDSMKLAFRVALDPLLTNGKPNRDSVMAIVQQFKTALENAITPLLSATELATLKAVQPPFGQDRGGRGPGRGPNPRRPDHDTNLRVPPPAINDSLALAKLTQLLSLTNTQVVAVKSLADSLMADTTLTPEGRHDAFRYQLTNILTPAQLAILEAQDHQNGHGDGDRRRGGHR